MRSTIAFVVLLAACSAGTETPSTPVDTAPNVVSLSSTEFAFAAPDTIPAGWTTLRLHNRGQEIHYGHIVRLDSGRTVKEAVDAYALAIRTSAARPKWVKRFGGPGGVAPGDSASVTQFLEAGSYVWICPVEDDKGIPHFSKGEFKAFVIKPGEVAVDRAAGRPDASTTIRLKDFSFELDSVILSAEHTVRVENAGAEPHDLVVMKLAPGKTAADLMRSMNPERARRPGQAAEPPPSPFSVATGAGGNAVIAPGMETFFSANWGPGEYVLLCMTTAPDGRSHIEHGMVKQFRIP